MQKNKLMLILAARTPIWTLEQIVENDLHKLSWRDHQATNTKVKSCASLTSSYNYFIQTAKKHFR
ncbi:MAG: hypothetical protein J6568_06055 [Snodgrassella sp.]|nr:hypothetical protein [Snodgrassella sp.]